MSYELTPAQLSRFMSRIDREAGLPCWMWTGAKTSAGYGETWNGKVIYAHRVAYELWVGPIPSGMTIDHLCHNPPCVNPTHLEACSQRTNILRSTGQSAINARKTHCIHGHAFDEANTRIDNGKRVCRACRAAYDRKRYQYAKTWKPS